MFNDSGDSHLVCQCGHKSLESMEVSMGNVATDNHKLTTNEACKSGKQRFAEDFCGKQDHLKGVACIVHDDEIDQRQPASQPLTQKIMTKLERDQLVTLQSLG